MKISSTEPPTTLRRPLSHYAIFSGPRVSLRCMQTLVHSQVCRMERSHKCDELGFFQMRRDGSGTTAPPHHRTSRAIPGNLASSRRDPTIESFLVSESTNGIHHPPLLPSLCSCLLRAARHHQRGILLERDKSKSGVAYRDVLESHIRRSPEFGHNDSCGFRMSERGDT